MADLIKMFYNEKGDRIYPKTNMGNVIGDAPLDTDCTNITTNGKRIRLRFISAISAIEDSYYIIVKNDEGGPMALLRSVFTFR